MMLALLALLVGCNLNDADDDDLTADVSARITLDDWNGFVKKHKIVSKPYHIDKILPSMVGPSGFDYAKLVDSEQLELVWVTGYKTVVVDSESEGAMSQEYMCHANLDFDAKTYYEHFPKAPPISGRVFTLSQGQQEIHFPAGMGIPLRSDLQLSLATQVLNLNIDEPDLTVRHQVEIEYIRDSDLNIYREAHPGWDVVPLYQTAVQGFKALENARYYGVPHADADADELGEGCAVGSSAIEGDVDEDAHGQKFTAHWIVPPGKELNRTNVTRFLNLPYDTTAYYIATHLHPFSESLTLTDLTTGKQVYQSKVRLSKERIGIDEVDIYSSFDGIELHQDHEYELTSVYNNTSDEDVDSMAVLYFYALDVNFDRERTMKDFQAAAKAMEEELDDGKTPQPEKTPSMTVPATEG